jgi:hypothetical protein
MKALITHAGDFIREAQVNPIEAVPGSYWVQFRSQMASARQPHEWRNNFDLVLQKHELEALRDLIDAAL